MKKGLLFLLVLGCSVIAHAQRLNNDCIGALQLCGAGAKGWIYQGPGYDTTELPSTTCLNHGEHNSAWYTLEVKTSGVLNLVMHQNTLQENIDFTLFDITGHTCADIATGIAPEVRCSRSFSGLYTGMDSIIGGGVGHVADSSGPPLLASLQVQAGEKYMLLIDDATSGSNTIILDFSNSSATLVNAADLRSNAISPDTFFLDDNVNWKSASLKLPFHIPLNDTAYGTLFDASRFVVDKPGWHVDSVMYNGFDLTVLFDRKNILDTAFNLIIAPNTLFDNCGNGNRMPDTVHVVVVPPVFTANYSSRQLGDSILVTDLSILADSVYYFLSTGAVTTYFYQRNPHMKLFKGFPYTLCQVAINATGRDTICKVIQLNELSLNPEQDCLGAIKICGREVFTNFSYTGKGANGNEVPPGSCIASGEHNSVWYQFEIKDPGMLRFLITPNASALDDYDFALYDVTGHTCADIVTGISPEVRCNFAFTMGTSTGLDTGGTATTAAQNGNAILAPLAVTRGQQFRLLVDNFTTSTHGFHLDFTSSTATFVSDSGTSLFATKYDTVGAGYNYPLHFASYINCAALDTNGGNFELANAPAGVYISKALPFGACAVNNATVHSVMLTFSGMPFADSTLDIIIKPNSLPSFCSTANTVGDTMHLYLIGGTVASDFGYTLSGNVLTITDGSHFADSVFYYVLDSGIHKTDATVTYYYSRNPTITVPGKGYYTICQVAINGTGSDTTCQVLDTYYTGIDNVGQQQITISPNPTTGIITVSVPHHQGTIQLYNILGALQAEQRVAEGDTKVQMDISVYPQGTYLLKVGQQVFKIIKY